MGILTYPFETILLHLFFLFCFLSGERQCTAFDGVEGYQLTVGLRITTLLASFQIVIVPPLASPVGGALHCNDYHTAMIIYIEISNFKPQN